MVRTVTTGRAAALLGTTRPTVVGLIEKGDLPASKEQRGSRFCWQVDEDGLREFLDKHGRYDDRRRLGRSKLARLEASISELRDQVRLLTEVDAGDTDTEVRKRLERERDDLRARIVGLEEALARAHSASELQRQADDERAAVVRHLLEAAAASERADTLRRRALAELEEALRQFSRPGHAAAEIY
jgi:excisionase family DNA binding protein